MKKLLKYMRLPYTIEIKKEYDGSYVLAIKELPGCIAIGSTLEEAKDQLYFSMRNYLESCMENSCPIPLPLAMRNKHKQ